jgi:YbbR domain-containing protein
MAYIGFRHHLGLKFVSIALAALLWVVVSGEQTVERAMRIPLEFTNLPAQLEVVGDAPAIVDVRVRGSSGALNRIAGGQLVAVLDLRLARSGRRLFHLGGSDVRTPFGVDVVQVNPSTVSMTFEASGSKVVPIVPTVEGDPADGFVVGTVTAEPSTVEVLGPVSVLAKLTRAITEPVTVGGASAPMTETVNIGVPDVAARLRTPQTARVGVVIGPAPVEWSVGAIAVKARNAQGQVQVQVVPAQITAWVRGPREAMTSDGGMFDATVDVDGLKPGQFQLAVSIVAPARVGVIRLEPAVVRVRIR